MSHLDESEYDDHDRGRDGRRGRGRQRAQDPYQARDPFELDQDEQRRREELDLPDDRGPRRATQPARPAWDAATYGTADDVRLSRPPAGGGDYRNAVPPPPPLPPPPPPPPSTRDSGGTREWQPPAWEPPAWDPPAWESPPEDRYRGADTPIRTGETPTAYAPPPPDDPFPGWTRRGQTDAGPPEGRRSDRSRSGEPPRSADPYPAEPYQSAPHRDESYQSRPYQDSAYREDSYREGSHREDSYRDDSYRDDSYPGGVDEPAADAEPERKPRAGRNLPAAIGVGVGLGAVAAASLFFWRPAFLGLLVVIVGIGIWELVRAIRVSGVNPPLVPLVAGGGLMTGLAWWGQADALTFGLMVTVLAAMVWRLADGVGGYGRDVTSAALVAVYLPFMAGFAALLASPPDGDLRVIVTLAGVVLSDTGGYIAGVFFGRHPMAPTVSPKKSWEGLAGSLVATAVGGAILLPLAFDVHWYWGAVFGLAVSAAAVIGDLGESMLKRDLGVKDMSNLLPGHGGLMDRLDSILLAAPTAYVLLAVLAPVT